MIKELHAYGVQSESDPTKWYEVLLGGKDKAFRCNCPDHIYRRRACKHIERAMTAFLHGL